MLPPRAAAERGRRKGARREGTRATEGGGGLVPEVEAEAPRPVLQVSEAFGAAAGGSTALTLTLTLTLTR